MKTKLILSLAPVVALLVTASSGFGQGSGIFGVGLDLSITNSGTSTFNLYEMTLFGDARFNPDPTGGSGAPGNGYTLGRSPTLVNTYTSSDNNSTWATGDGGGEPANNNANDPSLGTFRMGLDTLTLNGGEILTYKNGGANVSAADIFYQINGAGFNDISLAFNQDSVNGNTGDQRWYTDGANVNVLHNLGPGTYTLNVYYRDSNTVDVNDYISNNSANFNATFTVVPEPSTLALSGLSGLMTLFVFRRRK